MINIPKAEISVLIVGNDKATKEISALQNSEYVTLEAWPKDINLFAQQVMTQNIDILCLYSNDKSKQVLDICEILSSLVQDESLSIFIVGPFKQKQFIKKAYAFGVQGVFIPEVDDIHFEHQLQLKLQSLSLYKESQNQLFQQSSSLQLAKLCDFTWFVEDKKFQLACETKQLLGLKDKKPEIGQQEFFKNVSDVITGDFSKIFKQAIGRQQYLKQKIQIQHPSMGLRDLLFIAKLDNDYDDSIVYRGYLQDISGFESNKDSIHHLAYHDSLTGLANRRHLVNQVQNLVIKHEKNNDSFSLLFLDLDGFKQVNDHLGHEIGDLLLIEVAQHLQLISDNGHFNARLGGDEFCIVVDQKSDLDEAILIANKIIDTFKHSLFLEKYKVHTSFSIGIAQFPEHGKSVSELLKAADMAMYEAKSQGKHCYETYHPELTEKNMQRIALENELFTAYQRDQFELYYQPQISLTTQKIIGVEALVRWLHPTRGLIYPDQFIEIAESTRLINKIGNWVLNKACEEGQILHQKGLDITVAVNISPIQLYSEKFYEKVEKALLESGFNPHFLELEITESTFQINEKNIQVMERLRELGVKIAIDDFGTGYSNLSSLNQLPVDVLKIDREFIKNIPHDNAASALAASIIGMAKIRNLKIVAEGIETVEQIQYLQGVSCDIGQGYFIGRPMEFAQILMFLRRQILEYDETVKQIGNSHYAN